MLKVTIKFTAFFCFFCFAACNSSTGAKEQDLKQHLQDSLSEARIDSAYTATKSACDTAMIHTVPILANSFLHGDTAFVKAYLDSAARFSDPDKKVEKVVLQLKADCDSNLLKETYKKARLLQALGSKLHKRPKV